MPAHRVLEPLRGTRPQGLTPITLMFDIQVRPKCCALPRNRAHKGCAHRMMNIDPFTTARTFDRNSCPTHTAYGALLREPVHEKFALRLGEHAMTFGASCISMLWRLRHCTTV